MLTASVPSNSPAIARFPAAILAFALLASVILPTSLSAQGRAGQDSNSASGASAPRDPFMAPPSAPLPDSAAQAQAPMQEAVKLSTQGAFTLASPRVGDSLDYVVQVEWEDTQVPVIVLAPDSLDFPGFKIIGQATVHKKLASGQSVRNHTEFIFRLRAQAQGPGKAASMKLRYLTGLSRQEEAVFIPTAHTDILPAPTRLLDMAWFKILLGLIILGGAGALGRISFKLASRKKAAKTPPREDLRPAVATLKNRLRSAQNSPDASKEILLEMENLATRFLRDELSATGISPLSKGMAAGTGKASAPGAPATAPALAPARFESMLSAYLAGRNGSNGSGPSGSDQEWARLGELFRHARFAGGYKEPHELQDAFRTFRKCLKITGEDEHE